MAASKDLLSALRELLAARENKLVKASRFHNAIDTGWERKAQAGSMRADRRLDAAIRAANTAISKATK